MAAPDHPRSSTQEFAESVAGWTFSQLPTSVVKRAKQVLLDGTGTALAATDPKHPIGQILRQFTVERGRAEQSQLYGSDVRTDCETAALVNATFGYYIDNEPHHAGAIMHPIAIVGPAVLAVGEHLKSSGADVLTALVAGVDVACRLSYALDGSALYARGFHPSSVAGTFGSVAATGMLRELRGSSLTNAYGLAGTQASGLLAWVSDDMEQARPFNIGIAARNGVVASHLAACGLSGAPAIFEGKYPLSTAFTSRWDESALFDGLGEEYKLMELYIKLYACVAFTHPGLDGLLDIISSGEITANEISSITLRFPSKGYKVIDDNALRSHCAQYLMALATVTGGVDFYDVLNDASAQNPMIASLSERVTVTGDTDLDKTYPDLYRSVVDVELHDGRKFTRDVSNPMGSPKRPLDDTGLHDKFRRSTSSVLSERQQQEMIDAMAQLEDMEDISEFTRLLGRGRSRE